MWFPSLGSKVAAPDPAMMFASWPVRKGKGKGTTQSFLLRAWPRNGIITFAHIPLVGTQSPGHTQLQGKLGNVAFSRVAKSPLCTGEFYYLLFKNKGYQGIISSLCKEAISQDYSLWHLQQILQKFSYKLTRKAVMWWPENTETGKSRYSLMIKIEK